MAQSTQQWDLFGFDVRLVGKYWRAAWREFLWGYDSPVKARLDEVVKVHSEDGVQFYHAGEPVADQRAECEAILLPDQLVLAKKVTMPLAVESDLDTAMDIEVKANSPFPEEDTGYGWKIISRDEYRLHIQLVIVSLSSTMSYLGRQYDSHDVRAREVWAKFGGAVIVLNGFGEQKRFARYKKRLVRVGGIMGLAMVLLVCVFAASSGMKYLELNQYESMSAEVARASKKASRMRTSLLEANETVSYINSVVVENPDPRQVLAKLTNLLGDDASLVNFSLKGRQLKFLGRAGNAAQVIQELTGEPTFARVETRTAITKIGAAEQFTLEIELKSEAPL
jgi:general secretion pathway protein L